MISKIVLVLISYFSAYFGHLLGKLSNDELKYKNYIFSYIWVFILFSSIIFSLNFLIAPAVVFLCYLLFRTSYIWNSIFFFVGITLVLTPYFTFAVSVSCIFSLTFGAIVRTKVAYPDKKEKKAKNILKKSFAYIFLNSFGFYIGILFGFLFKFIF
jgi:hypothetical protein